MSFVDEKRRHATPLDMWRKILDKPNASAEQLGRELGKDDVFVLTNPPSLNPFSSGYEKVQKYVRSQKRA